MVTTLKLQQLNMESPKGQYLGLYCFCYILIVNIQGNAKLVLYADDTSVFFSGVDNDELFTCANNWLSGLNMWLTANKLQLNTAKTKYLLFRSRGQRIINGRFIMHLSILD